MVPKTKVDFSSVDGLNLIGDIWLPKNHEYGVLFVHGILSNRNKEGLSTFISEELFKNGIASMSFDFRGHGESNGTYEQLTLYGVLNDLLASIDFFLNNSSIKRLTLISASFSGGIAIHAGFMKQKLINNMVLLNPRLDYSGWITNEPYWSGKKIVNEGSQSIRQDGYLPHGSFRMGIPFINEVLHFKPADVLKLLPFEILFVHGTKDTVIPILSSQERYNENGRGQLKEIKGAEHGFVHPGSDTADDPLSQQFRKTVSNLIINWVMERVHG